MEIPLSKNQKNRLILKDYSQKYHIIPDRAGGKYFIAL